MPNPVTWITNVGKSIGYSMMDQIQEANPTIKSFKEDNTELFKTVKDTIKFRGMKDIGSSLEDNKYFKIAKEGIDNLKDDLRTGKLYNKEREEQSFGKAAAQLAGFDDSDFGFDMNGDFGFGDDDIEISDSIEEATMSTNDMMDIVGEKTSKAISSAVIGSSEYIVKSGRKNTQALFKQNNILFSRLHNDMKTINANIGSILDFGKEATTTHYNNSATFFTNMTTKMDETNSLLKELVDIQKEAYGKNEEERHRYGSRYNDIVDSQGLPNFSNIIENIKKNVKNNSMLDMIDMGVDMGLGAQLTGSPGKFISDIIAKSLIPKSIKKAMEGFNESLSSIVPNLLMNIMSGAGDSVVKSFIADLLGLNTGLRTGFSTSGYKKDAVPFDGVTRKAITEVIPTYLSKILSAISNSDETRYDYSKGEFVTLDDIRKEFSEITTSYANRTFYNVDTLMKDYAQKIKFDKDNKGDFITKEQFAKNLEEFYEAQYRAGKVFSDRRDGNIDAATYGLSGGKKAEISAKIMTQMWKNLPRRVKMNIADNMNRQREYQNDHISEMEFEGISPNVALFNNSGKNFGVNKDVKRQDAAVAAGKYNSNILSVLVDIRKEVSYIRKYGLSGKNKPRRSKGKYEVFDKFDPYKTPDVAIEEYEYGYDIYEDEPLTKKDDEDIEEYTKRSISEYRQINDQIQRANRKKGPFEFLFNLLKKNKNKGRDIDETINRPVQFITSIATKLDNAIYDLLFGREKGNGEEDKGVLQRVGDAIKNTFDNVNIWINENILEPIRENLTKEKLKNATKKFFGFFGIDIEQVGKDVKRFLFGEKDNKGNRTKNGLFGGFVDSLKDSFKDVFGWVKGSAKEVYDESGVKDVVEGKLNESGKTKKKNKKNAKAVLRNQKKKAMQKKDDESDEEDNKDNNVDGQAAEGIKTVPRTGIYALSKGEAVIPPDYNHSNIMRRYSNEQRAIDRFKKYGKINMLAEGSDGESTQKEQAVKESKRKLYEEYQARKKAGLEKLANTRLERSDYEELNLKYSVLDEIGKFGKLTKEFFGNAFDKGGNVDKDNLKNNFTEIADSILGDAKNYLPQITAGGILGASASIATGMIVSPLLAGAVGAGVGLVVKSEAVQKLLFGEDITDEDGKTVHKNGLLPENVSNMIQKYAPSMAKGATLGAITSIIPFVPGGPVSGIILGSALGFMNKNEKIHNYLFGEEGKLKGIKDKLKTVLPKMGAGAVLGGLASPIIPGAFVTNMILGSAIGFVTDTEQFKDAFWGEKDKDGKRTGGIYQKVMGSISKPIHKFLKENSEYFTKWFQDTIKRNVKDFFDPLKRRIKDLGTNILNIFKRMGEKFTDTLKLNVFNKLFLFAEKLVKPGSFLYKLGRGFITNTIGLPFNIIGGIGRRMKDSDVRRGKANYMTTANERLEYRKKRKMSSLIWKDKAKKSDEAMNQMSQDDLDLALKSVRGLMNGKDNARHEYINSKNDLSANILRSNLKGRDRKNLVKLLERDDLDGIRGYLDANGIKDEDKAYINTLLNESQNKILNSKYVYDKFKTGEERTKLETELKKFGFDLKKLKPTDLEKYLANELENRKETNKEAEDKTNKEVVKRWRVDVYDSLKQANETLRNIERLLDPNYTPTKEEQEAVANNPIGKQADKAKEVNYELRTEDPTEAEIADEERRMHNANMADSHSRKKLRNKLNRQSAKERERNDKDDMRRLDPSIGMSIFARAGIKTKDIFRNIADYRKYMVDELSGYNDDVDDPEIPFILRLSRMVKNEVGSGANRIADYAKDNLNKDNIRNVVNSKIQKTMIYEILKDKMESRKNSVLNEKNEETEKDSNSTEQTIFDKIKSYIKDKSDKFETSYYNGIAIRNKVDENGNVEADMSDSETVKALKERDEDRSTQKGILDSITNLPSKIGEFFGIGKNKDKEPKENILGKIIKWTGMGMLALMVAPKVAEFVKNTVVPVVKETVIPAIIKVGTDFKDGIMEGFFGKSDHEGGLANKIGEKIGEGAKWVVDEGVPALVRTVEDLLSKAIPWLAEQLVRNIPGLIRGIGDGLGKLGASITDALANKKVYTADDIIGINSETTFGGIKSIDTNNNTVDYTPSSKWNTTGEVFNSKLESGNSLGKDQYGNNVQVVDSNIEKDVATEYSNLKGSKNKNNLPKAYTEIGKEKLDKYKSTIDEVLDDNITLNVTNPETGETTRKTMSGYDLLNSDDFVYWTKTENRDGTFTNTGVRGYELLNNSTVAKDILGIDLKLDRNEMEENAKEKGYDHGESLSNITTDNPFHRAARAVFSSIRHGGTSLGVQGIKGVKHLFDITKHIPGLKNISRLGGALASGTAKVAEFGSKIIPTVANGISKLPDVIKKANDKFIDSGKLGFLKRFKDFITNVFKNSTIINKISKAIGKPIKKVTSALANLIPTISKEVGEELAENAAKTAAKSLFKKVFAVAAIVWDFQAGYRNAANIAQILEDLCTPPIKVVAGLVNVITEQFTFGFVNPTTVFNLILNGLKSLFDDKDILDIDKKRDETDRVLLEEEEKTGIATSVEDYNKNYNKGTTEYNVAQSQARQLGLTGEEATKYIEDNIGSKNTVAKRVLEKDKKKINDDQAKWDAGFEEAKRNSPLLTKEGYESMVGPRPLATGTPYVPNSGLYALSKGELVIPKLAEGTNPFTLFSNAIGNIKSILSSSKLEDNIKNIYKYANSGDDKFFKEDALSTDPTSKTINAIAKKLFTPVYAVEKMQNYFVKSLNDELGDGDKVLELFNTQLAETNKYLTGDLSMKNYWNDKLDDNKSMYGNMAKVITNIYKSLQFPMILAKSLFQMQAGRSSNDSGNVDAVSTQNSTANVSTSSISADLSSISTEGTTSTSSSGSTTLSSIKDIMNNIDLAGKIPEGSSGDQYKHLVVKYGEKNVIPFKNRDNKVVGYQIKLKNGRTKYIAVSKNAAVTGYVPGRKPSSVVHNNPNSISGHTAKGSGLFVGAGSEYPPIPIESPANSVSDMHYKYSKLPKIRPLSSVDKLDYSTENITSTGDNFVSQVDSNVSNIRFKTKRDTIRQTVATSGCAPAAATMIINSLRGKDIISMNTATKDAIPYKVPNGGVTSKYFDDEFDKYGIGTDYLENNSDDPNKNHIIRAIRERRPTILLGQDSSNKNKSNSPFGPNPHYVVADSISKDGKYIFINDPESKKPRIKYLLKSILPKVRVGISTFLGKGGRKLGKLYIGSAKAQVKAPAGDYIGKNTKRFESGDKGPRATGSCGNDGGGSYGSYQMIYSGSAKSFWAEHFAAKYGSPSSPSDLNSKWLKAVDEIGESAFFAKEWGYILDNYYKPAVAGIKKAGFDPDNYSRAMQDCIWSWAVHRGASGCISEFKYVMAEIKDPMNADEITLINKCYDVRGQKMTGQWSSIATGRYGTGSDSERVVMLSLVGQPPIDYTAPDGVLFAGSTAGTDSSVFTENNNTGDGEYKSILDILFAPFDMLAASHKLIGSNNGNNAASVGTTEYNADGISGPVSADPAIAQKQVQVVAKMKSVYGKLKYGQANEKYPLPRDPDTGSGDCSSTVQWAYQKTLGVDVGSWSGGQADSSNTYLVDGGHGSGGKTDESKLQLGDIMIYGPDNHAEMYFGHGKVLTHGNPDALGPVVADVNRRDDYWGTKRLNQFRSNGTANYDSSASTTFNTGQTAHNSQTSMSGYTASGSGLVGRGSFVSQLDPRYANRRFNRKGDTINQTIGDSGCAPAAATMVLNDINGRASMLDSSRLALQYKDTNDGVSADYFGDIYSRHGLNANYYNRKEQVTSDLYGGKDVVLLGSDRKNRSKSNSPFGPNPHYVVASGISKDGRSITIKDPEGKRPKKYSTNKILNNTKLGIGYGSGLLNKVLKNYKGRGFGAFSGILYVGDSRFDGMKDCVSESGVYFISKSSMGLKWLRTTARSQISAKVKSDPNLAVVFNLGVNDLYNKKNYINTYKEIKAAHPNVKFFFMSVNPVDHDPHATDAEVVDFNNTMKEYWGSDYLDIYSYLKSDGYKTTDGIHYDDATSKKIHNKCKEMISGLAPTGSTSTTGSTMDTSEDSILDRILGTMDNLAVKYGLMRKVGNTGSDTAATTTISGPGSEFPKYTLSDSAINDIATGVTGETGGDSMFTSMQEASQMANLNEVIRKRSANESGIITTIHDGWYSPNSWTRGVTNTAKEAVKKVFVEGKRTLPRYVTEHDTFPLDIKNAKNRSEYKFGDPVSNRYGSNYKFYDFFGENKDGDISGYFQSDYEKYKNDQPWSGSGSGLVNTPKYEYKQKYSGRSSRLNNISDVFDTFTNAIESSASINANNSNSGTISNNDKDLVAMMKTIIKLLAKVADNTNDISDIISILSKLVDLQSTVEKTGEIKSNINDLKRQLTSKLNSHNKANIGSGDLYNLMNNIESLATE